MINYYKILGVSPRSNQTEIKKSYRILAKKFHPDSQNKTANHDKIISINQAYEILSDPHKRQCYDRTLSTQSLPQKPRKPRKPAKPQNIDLDQWLQEVYHPVNENVELIFKPFQQEIDHLSGDPFDDELMADFQAYIETCQHILTETQNRFRSTPNPSNIAGVAAHLYYCLNHIGDGIEELNMFTLNYDESYLHTGHEFFRIADSLLKEAQAEINQFL